MVEFLQPHSMDISSKMHPPMGHTL